MNSQSDTSLPYAAGDQASAPAATTATRTLYWSIRREVWENRSIYLAPLIVTAIVLFATLISTIGLPRRIRNAAALAPAQRHAAIVRSVSVAPAPIILISFMVGIFYCLDALHGERRDRSILFWKSLPVSDLTTVLSKASIPLVILPAIGLVLGEAVQIILLFFSTLVLAGNGINPAILWGEFRFFQEPLIMIYGLAVFVLWYAPIYGWLLMISAWARRVPLLWAILPLMAVALVEKIVFNSMYFVSMLQYRVGGAMKEAFAFQLRHGSDGVIDQLSQLEPANFLSRPGLWVGLLFAAAFLAAAVRLRRYREPI